LRLEVTRLKAELARVTHENGVAETLKEALKDVHADAHSKDILGLHHNEPSTDWKPKHESFHRSKVEALAGPVMESARERRLTQHTDRASPLLHERHHHNTDRDLNLNSSGHQSIGLTSTQASTLDTTSPRFPTATHSPSWTRSPVPRPGHWRSISTPTQRPASVPLGSVPLPPVHSSGGSHRLVHPWTTEAKERVFNNNEHDVEAGNIGCPCGRFKVTNAFKFLA